MDPSTSTGPSPRRRGRLQRSERLQSESGTISTTLSTNPTCPTHFSSWEALVRDTFGHIAWPIKIASWELVDERCHSRPTISSSATELISRRGVFSRRNYGSADQLPSSDVDAADPNSRRFRLENGESLGEIDEVFGSPSAPILENPEHQTRWYFKFFLGKLHQNYVGIDNEKNPYFLSIVVQDSVNHCAPMYRAILFRKHGSQKIALPLTVQHQKLTAKQLLAHFAAMDGISKTPKEMFSADIQKDLLLLEEQEGSVNFKFGVVYMKSGQTCDDDMLSNESGSRNFDEFLHVLGDRVTLKGWDRFRGGLDVKGDMTGQQSVYTMYEGHEIMFHVSTLLPFSRDNRQQVERKRHIGNDIVNIVFVEGDAEGSTDFLPTYIKSQFTHIFAVVTKTDDRFKLAIFCDESVPPFGPTLPNPPYFNDAVSLREFLLVKLINGEKATFLTPTFARKRERTLEMLIKDLYEDYMQDGKSNMLNRRAFSEVLSDPPRTSKLKEDARQVEFVRIGQALKLEAIVRGDAPTSLASTAGPGNIFKRAPWEPQCFYAAFNHRGNIVGDSFGQDAVLVASDEGTYIIRDNQTNKQVFDKSFCVRQMSVIEDHGVLLVRGGSTSNKDSHRVYVFRLSEFSDDQLRARCKNEVRERRLDKTKGCHLYAISKGIDGYLRMIVSVGRKMLTYQWRYTAAWTSWCPNNETDTVDGFIYLREITLQDVPTIITILDRPTAAKSEFLACIGFKHHIDIVCAHTGVSSKLHEIEYSKRTQTHLVAAIDLCDGEETELLLCYNHTCHFQKLQPDSKSTEFDFQWNSSPTSVICAFPYIIAFTAESMEIRLLVNGNLVHNVTMTDLDLITSKRDIFFSTTAPEFISKDFGLKCIVNEQDNHSNTDSSSQLNVLQQRSEDHSIKKDLIVNHNHTLSVVLPGEHGIQRAKSLQKPRTTLDEPKRHLSKSNSCGQDYTTPGRPSLSPIRCDPNEQSISTVHYRKIGDSSVSGEAGGVGRSHKFHSCRSEHYDTPVKVKPLRIFRIPLANLTGAHSHYHSHSRVSRSNVHKIDEEVVQPVRSSSAAPPAHRNRLAATKQLSDTGCVKHKDISELATKEPRFSSL